MRYLRSFLLVTAAATALLQRLRCAGTLTAHLAAISAVALLLATALGHPLAAPPVADARVARCKTFIVFSGDGYRYRATDIRRSSRISCRKTRNLLRGSYGQGPLRPLRVVYGPNGSGRPIYWFRGGWRCSNGAGGAGCRNVKRDGLNEISNGEVDVAVSATVSVSEKSTT